MRYSSTMENRNIKLVIIMSALLFQGCDMKKNEEASDIVICEEIKTVDFKEYFSIDTYDEENVSEYDYIWRLNNDKGFYNHVNSLTDVEIRILSHTVFDKSYYYRLIYSKNGWKGEIYVFEEVTKNTLKKSDFTPVSGWEVFEKALVDNDILNWEELKFDSRFLHPRGYTIQVVTPFSMKVIALHDFYNTREDTTSNYSRIKNLMDLIVVLPESETILSQEKNSVPK